LKSKKNTHNVWLYNKQNNVTFYFFIKEQKKMLGDYKEMTLVFGAWVLWVLFLYKVVPFVAYCVRSSRAHAVTRPLVVCGPSGVGKDTLVSMVCEHYPRVFTKVVTHTTRKPRTGEADGDHYHFVTREQMQKDIQKGNFVEHAEVHGHLYGTSLAAVERATESGRVPILILDTKGAQTLRERTHLNPFFVFLLPSSHVELEERIRGRYTEESVRARLRSALAEIEFADRAAWFHYKMVNKELQSSYTLLVDKLMEFYPQMT
jgi:guanylate kinase